MELKKSDFLVCIECGMNGDRGCFEDESDPTCSQCTRVYCLELRGLFFLELRLDEDKESFEVVAKTLVLEWLSKLEGIGRQKEGEVLADGISKRKTMTDSDKVDQEQKEPKQEKAATSQRDR